MAYFMLDVVQAEQALELDQGGSTVRWVKGLSIVNRNQNLARKSFWGIAVVWCNEGPGAGRSSAMAGKVMMETTTTARDALA
jgi:hypothetical protein